MPKNSSSRLKNVQVPYLLRTHGARGALIATRHEAGHRCRHTQWPAAGDWQPGEEPGDVTVTAGSPVWRPRHRPVRRGVVDRGGLGEKTERRSGRGPAERRRGRRGIGRGGGRGMIRCRLARRPRVVARQPLPDTGHAGRGRSSPASDIGWAETGPGPGPDRGRGGHRRSPLSVAGKG